MKNLSALILVFVISFPVFAGVGMSNSDGLSIHTCDNYAGAVCSIKFKGHEILNSYDTGRLLQSAVSFNGLGEAYNPTQGGAYADGPSPYRSSSQKLGEYWYGDHWITQNMMAYWQPYGGQTVSQVQLLQQVEMTGHTITVTSDFFLPSGATYAQAQFEYLTGYFDPNLSLFYTINLAQGGLLSPLGDGPGEQNLPIIFTTQDNKYAAGICSSHSQYTGGGYGRWRFWDTVKFNAVSRVPNASGFYMFVTKIMVGTLTDVVSAMVSNCPSQ